MASTLDGMGMEECPPPPLVAFLSLLVVVSIPKHIGAIGNGALQCRYMAAY